MRVKALLYAISGAGAAAALFGFGVAYYAIARYEPRAYHFILTTLGMLAAGYGFYQAVRTIRRRRIEIGNPTVALAVIAAGTASTIYGFIQGYRGLSCVAPGSGRVFGIVLVTIGLAGSLYGLSRGAGFVLRARRKQKATR